MEETAFKRQITKYDMNKLWDRNGCRGKENFTEKAKKDRVTQMGEVSS